MITESIKKVTLSALSRAHRSNDILMNHQLQNGSLNDLSATIDKQAEIERVFRDIARMPTDTGQIESGITEALEKELNKPYVQCLLTQSGMDLASLAALFMAGSSSTIRLFVEHYNDPEIVAVVEINPDGDVVKSSAFTDTAA